MDRGIKEYKRGAYEKALHTFRDAYDSGPADENVYASLSLFMIIKSEYELKNYEQVVSDSRIFEQKFSDSRYLPDVLFERAKALVKMQKYSPAMISAKQALSTSTDEDLKKELIAFCEDISRYYLSPRDLEMILPLVIAREPLSFFKLLLAHRYSIAGDHSGAERLLRDVKSELYTEYLVQKYKDITTYLNKTKEAEDTEVNIAVVLPLTGRLSKTGNQLLDGIKYAYESGRDENKIRVNLIIVDTKSEIRTGLTALKETLEIQNISAVLGPLNSETAIAMAPICEYAGVPMITPTATADDLVDMGNNIFQLNPEQQQRARALADFSCDSLGYERFAVVAPTSEYGIDISDAFKRSIEKNEAGS
ncbi:MAG: penicillin-binding protein activator [Candidatus Marinimicrobia bacterium]|nr:penicillin-binding protein activator [Candidatus Neomarinimicrobiota bacterium]